jgi:hypothetical protein
MRNKILMIAAMLAVMVAMTGIAAASPFLIGLNQASPNNGLAAGNPTSVPLTGTTTFSVVLTAIDAGNVGNIGTYNLTCEITPVDPTITVACPSLASFNVTAVTMPFPDSVVVTTNGTAPNSNHYLIVDGVTVGTMYPDPAAEGGIRLNTVPEFPTVALPIAAVIGLVFFFQNKKKKE